MKTITVMIHAAIITALFLLWTNESKAGGLIECNNCASPKNAALLSGSGLAVVMDFERARLSAFNVEYDREIRKWRAISTPVPAQIQMAFLRVLDATSAFRGPHEDAHAMRGGGSVVVLHPDNPGNSNGIRFPESYTSSNTFDIVASATLRTRLGQYLATELAGANTGSPTWNGIALSIQQAALNWAGLKGGGSITIMITWRDGSRTLYRVTPDNVAEAKYQKGESRDSTGNKVPDESIADPISAPSYAGQYYFGQHGDLDNWVRSAQMYGVPVQRGGSSRISCSWDGRTVYCQQY
ncbi:hypothetical protein I5T99_11885 [Stenotrophomonas maltophilia]|nr:hypothetical protein [Stenotrophomonas maltophilia]